MDDVAKIGVRAMDWVVTVEDDLVDVGRRLVAIQCMVREICRLVQAGEKILAPSKGDLRALMKV